MKSHNGEQNFYVLSAGREIQVPFWIVLSSGENDQQIKCTRVLRNLPGKRLVCAAEVSGQKVVAKFFLDSKKGKLHCRREEEGLLALTEAGINTPELLFKAALDREGRMPVLVFRMLEDAIDFTEAWESAKTDSNRVELLKKLTSVTAEMHEAGLIHNDAHPGNFMIAGNLLYAIDGASVAVNNRFQGLSHAKSIKNLAAVFAQFSTIFDYLSDEVFFAYLNRRKGDRKRSHFNLLTKLIRSQRKKIEKKYLRKIYRESSAQVCKKGWGHFMVCKRDCYTQDMDMLLRNPDAFISGANLLKDGNSSTVALVKIDNRFLVIKRYNIKNFFHALSRCLRPSRAWRSWKNAHKLSLLKIATPSPVALLEYKWGPLRSTAYFITEYVQGMDVSQWFQTDGYSETEMQNVVKKFIRILNIFHNNLITHGDFKATNFILCEGRLFVIDLDAMRSYWWGGRKFQKRFVKDCRRLMKNWDGEPRIRNLFHHEIEKLGPMKSNTLKLEAHEN
ncbi:MAG: lipopolysaccharide kinase InaA family protein [Desulfovibrionales bacterium]